MTTNARTGAELIAAERQRQIGAEGWTAEHDDEHRGGELARAAIAYAIHAYFPYSASVDYHWPWRTRIKPGSQISDLVKAGALIAAEIDRLQRAFVGAVGGTDG